MLIKYKDWLMLREAEKPMWHECYYGGAFSPIHYGHINSAKAAKSQLGINVVLLPSGNPPHKSDLLPFNDRIAMCEMVGRQYGFRVNPIEGGVSGSTPTVKILTKLVSGFREGRYLVPFLVGTDALASLPTWVDYQTLVQNVLWVLAPRSQAPINVPGIQMMRLNTQEADISSTEIRRLLRNKDYSRLEQLMPKYIVQYILDHKLFQ